MIPGWLAPRPVQGLTCAVIAQELAFDTSKLAEAKRLAGALTPLEEAQSVVLFGRSRGKNVPHIPHTSQVSQVSQEHGRKRPLKWRRPETKGAGTHSCRR